MAKSIMIQGTMSNVGKSIVTAGLCRLFKQEGIRVAPFKSQNMALNIFVTSDGCEMSRAQAIQAEAAGVEPSVLMNPIVLKPVTDMGSEVVVNGEIIGKMSAREYFSYKKKLIPVIKNSYSELAASNDLIVIEGAGSPVELNLNDCDIVNMGLAKMLDSPVLLVADIDRGGVFAQLAGTIWLLDEHERERVKGLIINKFRGDKTLFDSGIKILEEKTRKSVVGLLPYFDINVENEDSMREDVVSNAQTNENIVNVAIVDLPKMTNASDFMPLEVENGVNVYFVKNADELKTADLVILPGTADISGSLEFMKARGIDGAIRSIAETRKAMIFGIAEGFGMLCRSIDAEYGGEAGLGVVLADCVLEPLRGGRRVQCEAVCEDGIFGALVGKRFDGAAIGHIVKLVGENAQDNMTYFSKTHDNQYDGYCTGNVAGTSFHTFFYNDDCRNALVCSLRAAKGLRKDEAKGFCVSEYKNAQYDKLADVLRQNLDIEFIYKLLEK